MSLKKLLIMAGGTGGHIFPALAIAQQLRQQGVQIAWLGTSLGLEAELVPAANIPLHFISVRGVRGHGILRWFKAPFVILKAILETRKIIQQINPDAVLGMGGYVSGPGAIAAKTLHKTLFIHEQNAAAGLTNRLLARFATGVFQAFPNTFKLKFHPYTTGNPVRPEIANILPPSMRYQDFENRSANVLILGGSQGALILNQIIPAALSRVTKSVKVWHQTGKHGHAEAQEAYQKAGMDAKVDVFIQNMSEAFQWADLVICRAGALTVAELATTGVASILVPFPQAVDDHQTRNAEYLANHNAAIIIPQKKLNVEQLTETLEKLFNTPGRLRLMAQLARELSMAPALERVTTLCQELVNRESSKH